MRSFRLGDRPGVNATRLGRCRMEWARDSRSRGKMDGRTHACGAAASGCPANSRANLKRLSRGGWRGLAGIEKEPAAAERRAERT